MNTTPTSHIWRSSVRSYEVDYQSIVNNAVYFQYFEHARAELLREMGVCVQDFAQSGLNMVLLKTEISYLKSLKNNENFRVESTISRISKLKCQFLQELFVEGKQGILCTKAVSLAATVNSDGKPVQVSQFDGL